MRGPDQAGDEVADLREGEVDQLAAQVWARAFGSLAVARVTEQVRAGVVQMATGAWYDPVLLPGELDPVCVAGNPNMVTRDVGTSRLAQGCTGQLCLVQVSAFVGEAPAGHGYGPPPMQD